MFDQTSSISLSATDRDIEHRNKIVGLDQEDIVRIIAAKIAVMPHLAGLTFRS